MSIEKSVQRLTRDKILDVARRHFARFGFRKASLSEIAADLGVVKGALYYHLPGGKRELLEAVMAREDERLIEAMASAAEAEGDARRALTAAIEAKLVFLRQLAGLLEVRREVGEEIAALLFAREREFSRRERDLFEQLLQRGFEAGTFRDVQPRSAAASAIQAMLRALEIDEIYEPVQAERGPRLIDAVLDLVILGLERR